MKAHLAKLSLALLSVVFLLGCQDMGSEPVGPEGLGIELARKKPPKDGGGGGPVPADITLAGGLENPNTQVVGFKDRQKEIQLHTSDHTFGRINLAFNMTATYNNAKVGANGPLEFDPDVCVKSGRGNPGDTKLNKLFNLLQPEPDVSRTINFFWVAIDKTVLEEEGTGVFVGASEDHLIVANPDVDGSTRVFQVGTFSVPDKPLLIAEVSRRGGIDEDAGLRVEFTGGSVFLRNVEDKPGFNLTCPNKDTITMILTSQ